MQTSRVRGYFDFGLKLQGPSESPVEIPFTWHRGTAVGQSLHKQAR